MSYSAESLLTIGGLYHLLIAFLHLLFWKMFDWVRDLKGLKTVNKNIMQILNLSLIFVFLLFSYFSLFHQEELINSSLGNYLLLGICLFWLLRAAEQVLFFGIKRLLSMLLFMSFIMVSAIYGWLFIKTIT